MAILRTKRTRRSRVTSTTRPAGFDPSTLRDKSMPSRQLPTNPALLLKMADELKVFID
jgi:hypothetical protein